MHHPLMDSELLSRERRVVEAGLDVQRHLGGWVVVDRRGKRLRYKGAGSLWREDMEGVNIVFRARSQAVSEAESILSPEVEPSMAPALPDEA